MPLSDKEKQALKEKYKDQRRAMWAGESTLRRSNKTPSETQAEDSQFTGEEVEPPPRRSEEDNVPTPDEVQRIKEKIREQREETWEGAASTRLHLRRKQRQTDTDEHQLWDSSENERGPIVLTWKLALGVVGAIIVLIGLGVLLGYWFAS